MSIYPKCQFSTHCSETAEFNCRCQSGADLLFCGAHLTQHFYQFLDSQHSPQPILLPIKPSDLVTLEQSLTHSTLQIREKIQELLSTKNSRLNILLKVIKEEEKNYAQQIKALLGMAKR